MLATAIQGMIIPSPGQTPQGRRNRIVKNFDRGSSMCVWAMWEILYGVFFISVTSFQGRGVTLRAQDSIGAWI